MRHYRRYTKKQNPPNLLMVKKTGIQLLSVLVTLSAVILKIAVFLLSSIFSLVRFAARWLIKVGAVPFYALAKKLTLKTRRLQEYARAQFGGNFARNVVIYGGLSILFLFTATTNIKARELRPDEVGRNSTLYALLIAQSDYEIIEESGNILTGAGPAEARSRALTSLGVESRANNLGLGTDTDSPAFRVSEDGSVLRPDIADIDIGVQPRDKIITYTVQEGDTISQIAEQFNLSINTLLWENKIGPRDFIKPGQEIVILPVTGVSHTITRGETLSAIAARYRAKTEDILEVNKLADASAIQVGSKLVIPDGVPPPAPKAAPQTSSGLADIRDIFKPAPKPAGKLTWPTTARRITQYFRGWRHTGLDIGVALNQPIYAAESGVVITAGWNSGGYGYYTIIDHGNGIQTLYAHNNKLYVEKGDSVEKGEVIAASGSTGRSTGPHLHFEVRSGGNRVNPLDYL